MTKTYAVVDGNGRQATVTIAAPQIVEKDGDVIVVTAEGDGMVIMSPRQGYQFKEV